MPWVHLTPSFASGGAATIRGSNSLRIRTTSARTSAFRQTWMAKSQSRSGSSDNQRNATRQPSKGDRSPPARCFISRYKFVHQPIVRRSAHPLRLVGVPVIGRIAAEPRAQITSAPPGSVIDSLSLGGLGEPISRPGDLAHDRILPRHQTKPGCKFAPAAEAARLCNRRGDRRSAQTHGEVPSCCWRSALCCGSVLVRYRGHAQSGQKVDAWTCKVLAHSCRRGALAR